MAAIASGDEMMLGASLCLDDKGISVNQICVLGLAGR